ncbi:MAG: hypothetical protein KJO07_07635, partial [Deltaproteobacteria bacterium]|nr:hypothetical protein [Deltaproteobacteria bacterium]
AKDYLQAIDEAIIDLGAKLPARVDTPLPSPAGGRSPTGHTITATQALPLPHKRNVKLFIALGLGFLLVGLILLTLAARKGERSQAAETRPDAAPAKSAATLAGEALERGKPKEAIAVLTTDGVDISTDAQGQLLLGHAHAARNHAKQTLAAYRKAIELDSTLAEDAALNANLKVLAADKRTFEEAATMLIEELDDKQIKGQVLAKATTKGDGEWRHLALGLSEKLGFIDEVDLRSVYELDLAEGSRCGYRQAAVAKLRALGDPAAIPALQQAINRRGTRGRWRGRKINSCLADDAKKAIQYLRTLSKSP